MEITPTNLLTFLIKERLVTDFGFSFSSLNRFEEKTIQLVVQIKNGVEQLLNPVADSADQTETGTDIAIQNADENASANDIPGGNNSANENRNEINDADTIEQVYQEAVEEQAALDPFIDVADEHDEPDPAGPNEAAGQNEAAAVGTAYDFTGLTEWIESIVLLSQDLQLWDMYMGISEILIKQTVGFLVNESVENDWDNINQMMHTGNDSPLKIFLDVDKFVYVVGKWIDTVWTLFESNRRLIIHGTTSETNV